MSMGLEPFMSEMDVRGSTAVVTVHGEVDIATVDRLQECLAEAVAAEADRLVVDLSDSSFLGCVGVATIARAGQVLPGRDVVVWCPNRLARRVIELAGMDRVWQIIDAQG